MPELPEVEAVTGKLRMTAIGAPIRDVRVLRPRAAHPQSPDILKDAIGHCIESIERRGKNILLHLDRGLSLRVHLRMAGNLEVIRDHRLHRSAVRVLFQFADGRGLVFDDSRMLGSVNLYETWEVSALLGGVGVDPLSAEFTSEFFVRVAGRSSRPAKLFLMAQSPISGLGNIYSAEALFQARISPVKPMRLLSRRKLTSLHAAIQEVLREAIPQAVLSYSHPGHHESMGYRVYDREGKPCVRCRTPIVRMHQGGRSTYYCRKCQR